MIFVLRVLLVATAIAAALLPFPPTLIEAWYSRRLYPALQGLITPLTNVVPVSLLDVAVMLLLIALVMGFRRRLQARGFVRALAGSLWLLVTLAAVVYLLFLGLWGFNYRRLPLADKLDYDAARITLPAAVSLGHYAVEAVNTLYAEAHDEKVAGPTLADAFAAAQRTLGSTRLAVPGVAKRSLLEPYFRLAAIDGMTDPFFLEIIINPDTLPFERPFVLLHEWAHLAGYANEAEANFVAWLASTEGDAMARYSGWLAIVEHVAASLPRSDRAALLSRLAEGPQRDLRAAAARYATASPVVRTTARDVYDSYLRANRVTEGVASYTAVVRLMLGAGLAEGQRPKLRSTGQ